MNELVQESLPLHAPGVMSALEVSRAAITEAERAENESAKAHAKKVLTLYTAVGYYTVERHAAIKKEFAERKLAWCTVCEKVKPESEMQLALSEGRYQYSCGYEGGDYASRDYSNLHNACASCSGRLAGSHGQFKKAPYGGEYDSSYTFPVERREDGYWVNRSGWSKLVPKERWMKPYELRETPIEVFEALAQEWKFPSGLQVRSGSGGAHHAAELAGVKS